MDKLSRISPEDRENLTAYLDGELEEDGTRHIEAILSQSSVARTDVDVLSRTYDLLDVLPRAKASQDFVERTVATAKLETFQKPLADLEWFRAGKKVALLLLWLAALGASATAGYSLTNRFLPAEADLLLDEYPLLQDLDVYTEVDNIQFLERLSANPQLYQEIRREGEP